MHQTKLAVVCILSLLLLSCAKMIIHTTAPVPLAVDSKIAVTAFKNETDTPLADEYAQATASKVLKVRGFRHVLVSPPQIKTYEAQLRWAKQAGAKYMVTGNVREWSYLMSLDNEPLIGVTMQLIDTASKHTIWSADGSKKGSSLRVLPSITEELTHAMLVRLYATTS